MTDNTTAAHGVEGGGKLRHKVMTRLNKERAETKTCPASRHVQIIVDGMLDPKCPMHRDLLGYEPAHMAKSIASVLEGLWKARRWLKWQANDPDDYTKGGEWVPDMDAMAHSLPTGGDDGTV